MPAALVSRLLVVGAARSFAHLRHGGVDGEAARKLSPRKLLERLDKFDHDVYTEVLSLLDRLDLLEEDNQDLRNQVDALRRTQVKA